MIPKRPHTEENLESWLMSYADMITLLLAFFVIFVSTSEPKQDRLAAATKGMHEKFGSINLNSPYDDIYHEIQGIITSNNADRNIAVDKTSRGVRLEISALNFFATASADIPPAQLGVLNDIAKTLKSGTMANYTIEVEGHTDDAAASGTQFASNWELAAARAAHIVRLLIAQGVEPGRLKAVSYAETHPAVPNKDAAGNPIAENRARNQRVVIRVEQMGK